MEKIKQKTTTLIVYLLSLMVIIYASPIVAVSIQVQGNAKIGNDISKARTEAYQDALRNAALSAGHRVSSQTSINHKGEYSDSLQIRSTQSIKSSEIIHEQIEDGIITLFISAEIDEGKQDNCGFKAAQYRKRIAATHFPLLHPEHVGINDFYGFDSEISTDLLNRLAVTGNFLTREAKDIMLYDNPSQAPYIGQATISDDTLLSRLASERKVQYVISGVIRDLSSELESRNNKDYPILPSFTTFWGGQRKATKRNIVIDFYLHDTLSGELISKTTRSTSIEAANVIPEQAIAFGSRAFYDTEFGKAFGKILDQEVVSIQQSLKCRPFTMRIIDQKEGVFYLDAGTGNNVKAGDVLTVYIPDQPGEVFGVNGKVDQFGKPKTTIKITHVYPAYATAEPESGIFSNADIVNGYLIAY